MSFRFNFSLENEELGKSEEHVNEIDVQAENGKEKLGVDTSESFQAKCFTLNELIDEWNKCDDTFTIDAIHLNNEDKIYFVQSNSAKHFSNDFASRKQPGSGVLDASDLVPKIYEGGLKVWECSIDLANYISESNATLKDQTIMEIGCGIGLPGIAAANSFPKSVIFQDFNDFVLSKSTGPSVFLNALINSQEDPSLAEKIQLLDSIENADGLITAAIFNSSNHPSFCKKFRFISGDWSEIGKHLKTKADVILSSETIYDTTSYESLHDLLVNALSYNGVAYIAAKTFYFGVGGGTQSWIRFVKSKGKFDISCVRVIDAPLKREILKMAFSEM